MQLIFKALSFSLLILCLSSCQPSNSADLECKSEPSKNTTIIFNYDDFGTQALASSLIGMDKWPWVGQLDSPSQKFDINVVVYGGVDVGTVKSAYPVDESKQQDYRYAYYKDAVEYFYYYSEFLIDMHAEAGGKHDVSEQYEILKKIEQIETSICEDANTSTWKF